MKFTLMHHTRSGMNRYPVGGLKLWLLGAMVLLVLPGLSAWGTYAWLSSRTVRVNYTESALASMRQALAHSRQALAKVRVSTQMQVDELTRRLGVTQAELLRINAVGKRLLDIAGVNPKEFDFDSVPSVGGPEALAGPAATAVSVAVGLNEADKELTQKRKMLDILASVLLNREIDISSYISGRPVLHGWNSSQFGKRVDPFTGRPAWHEGMDFAGKLNDPIVVTAAGVVSFVGTKSGYGLTIEVSHGNGIVTRYGHNSRITVTVGQVVAKGEIIARMGSTGRSTGPHVHYEVLLKGRAVDPKSYVWRGAKSPHKHALTSSE